MLIQTLYFHETLGDLILSDPQDQGNTVIEGVLNLLGYLGVIVVKHLSGDICGPKLSQDLEAFGCQIFTDLSDHDLGGGGATLTLQLLFQNGENTFDTN